MSPLLRKSFLLAMLLCLTATGYSQPTLIYYNNDSLLIDGQLITSTATKELLDKLMHAKSRTGVIIGSQDYILDNVDKERRRTFQYASLGLRYDRYVKDPEKFSLSVRFAYEPGDQGWKKDREKVYNGFVLVDGQYFNNASTLETIMAHRGFALVKKGASVVDKYKYVYALVSYQDILLWLQFHSGNGELKLLEIRK